MLTLPIPLFAALLLGALALRAALRGGTPPWLLALISAAALQGVVISGHLHYGFSFLAPAQPVTAAIIPPLAWLAYLTVAGRGHHLRDLLHFALPIMVAGLVLAEPAFVDLAVFAAYFAYGGALLLTLSGGGDVLERTRLDSGDAALWLWRGIGIALIASALTDAVIFGLMASGLGAWREGVVSLLSAATLLFLGGISLSPDAGTATPQDPPPPPIPTEDDARLVTEMDRILTEKRLYLDPDLTLTRIARLMRVPAKALSAAVNKVTGQNISRHVNAKRIDHACALLLSGMGVTAAMFASGFNTKSNFNREFLRLRGQAPSDWLKQQDIVDKPPV
jgi:AraC-like DNA-binding protein